MYTFKDIWLLNEEDNANNSSATASTGGSHQQSTNNSNSNNVNGDPKRKFFVAFFSSYKDQFNRHFKPKYEYEVTDEVIGKIYEALTISGNNTVDTVKDYKRLGLDKYFPFVDFVSFVTAHTFNGSSSPKIESPKPSNITDAEKRGDINEYKKIADEYIEKLNKKIEDAGYSEDPLDYPAGYTRTKVLADKLKNASNDNSREVGKAFLEKENTKKMSIQQCLHAIGNQSFKLKKITNKPANEKEGGLDKVVLNPESYVASQKSIPMLFGAQYPNFSAKEIAILGIYLRKLFEHQRDMIIKEYSNIEQPTDPDRQALPQGSRISDSLINLYLASLLTEDARNRTQITNPLLLEMDNSDNVVDAEYEMIDGDDKKDNKQVDSGPVKPNTETNTSTKNLVILSNANVKDLYTNRSLTEVEVRTVNKVGKPIVQKVKVFNWKLVYKGTNQEIMQKATNAVDGGYTIENLKILKDYNNKYAAAVYDTLVELADNVDTNKLERVQQGLEGIKSIGSSLASIGGPNMGSR